MKMIIRLFFIVAGAVFLVWFLLPATMTVYFNIGNYTGIGLSLIFLLYGIFFSKVNMFLKNLWSRTAGKAAEIAVSAVILAILCLAVACMVSMGRCMKTGFKNNTYAAAASEKVSSPTVVVLGAKINGSSAENARPSVILRERLDAAYDYLMDHPDSYCVVSGGQGRDEAVSEAFGMKKYLVEKGIAEDRIFMEEKSTDTEENLKFTKELIEEYNTAAGSEVLSPVLAIVTNEFHEYRALKMADAQGISAISVPAVTVWRLFPMYYVREMYGILQMWFLK